MQRGLNQTEGFDIPKRSRMMGFSSKQTPAGGDCWALPLGVTEVGRSGFLWGLQEGGELCSCCSVTPSTHSTSVLIAVLF